MVEKIAKEMHEETWNGVLRGESILSEKEARDISEITRTLRKERGFRD